MILPFSKYFKLNYFASLLRGTLCKSTNLAIQLLGPVHEQILGSTQRRTFQNILQWASNLQRLRELACHHITVFPGKLKGVLHSQEDSTNIFPSQLHDMNKYVHFFVNFHNFRKFSKFYKKILPLCVDNDHLTKKFSNSIPADVFHLASRT